MKTQYESDNWIGQLPQRRYSPVKWSFRLNGAYMSYLDCDPVGPLPAFSGRDFARNDPRATAERKQGPIPLGKYFILDRESGGRMGWPSDVTYPGYSGVDRTRWFALWNSVSGDIANVNGVVRGNFRLHPAGYWGISEGCITISNGYDFDELEGHLRSSPPDLPVPENAVMAYGTVDVTQ